MKLEAGRTSIDNSLFQIDHLAGIERLLTSNRWCALRVLTHRIRDCTINIAREGLMLAGINNENDIWSAHGLRRACLQDRPR